MASFKCIVISEGFAHAHGITGRAIAMNQLVNLVHVLLAGKWFNTGICKRRKRNWKWKLETELETGNGRQKGNDRQNSWLASRTRTHQKARQGDSVCQSTL